MTEIAVGAPAAAVAGAEAAGAVHLFDGATGARIASIRGEAPRGAAGFSVEVFPASTSLPSARLAVGAPGEALAGLDSNAYTPGRVAIFSAATLTSGGGGGGGAGGALDLALSAADVTLTPPAGHTLFGTSVERGYRVPGQDDVAMLVGSSELLPAPAHLVDQLELDPAVTWFATLATTVVLEPPYTAAAYAFTTGEGSELELSHPYPGPAPGNPPTAESPYSMKEYGDVALNHRVDLDDVFLILAKIGATGVEALDADVDGDGEVTVADLAIALQNQGMGLREAINRRCGWLGVPEIPGQNEWAGGVLGCECVQEWLNNAPNGIVIEEPGERDPCAGEAPDEPPGGDPPIGQHCNNISIEEPADCEDFAACMLAAHQAEINRLYRLLNGGPGPNGESQPGLFAQLAAARQNAAEKLAAMRAAEPTVLIPKGIATTELRDGAAQTGKDITTGVSFRAIASGVGAGIGTTFTFAAIGFAIGGPPLAVVGALGGALVGIVTGATTGVLVNQYEDGISIRNVVRAQELAMTQVEAAANGHGLIVAQPSDTTNGAVVQTTTWISLVTAGNAWAPARDAYDAAKRHADDLARQVGEAVAAMLALSDDLPNVYDRALQTCMDEHFGEPE